MHVKKGFSILAAFAFVMLAAGMAIGSQGATAHNEAEAHPAHIHSGTCTQLGDVVYPLTDVSDAMMVGGTPMAIASTSDSDAIGVAASVTTVQSTLSDLLAGPHAINVHESAENIGTYIACGDIGGAMMGSSDLAIGLGELNDSGYSGIATLYDNGDGSTTVSVYLTQSAGAEKSTAKDESSAETPVVATPVAATSSTVAVSMQNFLFNPTPVEIKVGDTVTWTNNDAFAHTVTQTPSGSGFQSGTMQEGDTFSFTFDTAGTFDYYCEFHAGMAGQVIVS